MFNDLSTYIYPNPKSMNENSPEQQISLIKALVAFVSETKDIKADDYNPHYKSKFASLEAHLKELKPLAAKHGLALLQMPIGDGECVGVRNIILHKDGGSVRSDALVPAEKGMSGQQAGSIYSYIRRYSLASIAGIATDDDDAESDRIAKTPAVARKAAAPTATAVAKPVASAKPSVAAVGEAVAPFGDLKGTPLSKLPLKSADRSVKFGDLNYFANVWKPKPFGANTEISPRDLRVKAEAERLWAIAHGEITDEPVAPAVTSDDVPF